VTNGAFEAKVSLCPGDSGAPVVDRVTREIVGVVSLSAMDHDEETRGRSLFARVDGIADLIYRARAITSGTATVDGATVGCPAGE
jgi:V8-like Glu-specific endopeptidase